MATATHSIGRTARPSRSDMLLAERDAELATHSGYDPLLFGSITRMPMTPELRRAIEERTLETRLRQTAESVQLLCLPTLRQKQEGVLKQSMLWNAFFSDASARNMARWLNEIHMLGMIGMTGRQWQRVADHVACNRSSMKRELLENGMTAAQAEKRIEVFEILREGPRTERDHHALREAHKDPIFVEVTEKWIDRHGLDEEPTPQALEAGTQPLPPSITCPCLVLELR